jgi:hypothetical protein
MKSYAGTWEYDLIWTWDLCRCDGVKTRSYSIKVRECVSVVLATQAWHIQGTEKEEPHGRLQGRVKNWKQRALRRGRLSRTCSVKARRLPATRPAIVAGVGKVIRGGCNLMYSS